MKLLIFKHYLRRALKEPIGFAVGTGLPTVLILIISFVMMKQVPDEDMYMWNGYNVIATPIAVLFMTGFQFFGGNVLLDYIYEDFRGDRRWRMLSMPVKTMDYVVGILMASCFFGMIQGGLIIGVSTMVLDVYWGNPFILVGTLFACSALAQLLYMLLFLLIPKKGTIEIITQVVIQVMIFSSGLISTFEVDLEQGNTVVKEAAFEQYGTPISLARNAILDSGFIGGNMDNALLSLGLLYGVLAIFIIAVVVCGKRKGFLSVDKALSVSASKKAKVVTDLPEKSLPEKGLTLRTPTRVHRGQLTIYRFGLLRACRNPFTLLLNGVLPLILLFIPGLWRGEMTMGFSFVGAAIMYGAFLAARGILNDKLDGTIVRIFTAPVTMLQYLAQNLMATMTPLVIQVLAVGIIGSILNQWEMKFTMMLMLIYFLFAVASVALSFAWSCLFKEKETSFAIFSISMSIVSMIGGLFIPLQVLPNVLHYIGAFFPAFWASNGILALQGEGIMGGYWTSAGIIMLFAILFMVYGSKRRMI